MNALRERRDVASRERNSGKLPWMSRISGRISGHVEREFRTEDVVTGPPLLPRSRNANASKHSLRRAPRDGLHEPWEVQNGRCIFRGSAFWRICASFVNDPRASLGHSRKGREEEPSASRPQQLEPAWLRTTHVVRVSKYDCLYFCEIRYECFVKLLGVEERTYARTAYYQMENLNLNYLLLETDVSRCFGKLSAEFQEILQNF